MRKIAFLLALAGMTYFACTPKTTDEAKSSENETVKSKPDISADPCATFGDSRAGEQALDAHVIYRDYMKLGAYEEALPFWRQAFKAAPAADGKRQTHYDDGIKIYDYFLDSVATSEDVKRTYLDSIFYMYDRMAECYYANDPGYIAGRKAFDMYYKYRELLDDQEILDMFRRSLDIDGVEANSFVVNPFTALLVEMLQTDRIPKDDAVRYAKLVLEICEKHEDDEEEGWPIVVGYAPVRLEAFETVKGFYDCDYFTDKYYTPYDLAAVDCEVLFLMATRLRYGGCEVESDMLTSIAAEYQKRCRTTTSPELETARIALEEERYRDAIEAYLEYLEKQDDPERLAKFNLRIAKIYYAHVRDFPKSRQYAYKALEYKPNWGAPYMLIGKLYASSGPLCGPGRGWDSQIVTWPAIDKFQKAKSVDPSVATEANKLIASYSRYMPSVEDIFQRQLTEGDQFRVGCWIQENTRIRAARK